MVNIQHETTRKLNALETALRKLPAEEGLVGLHSSVDFVI
jgi:hypothetical protein